MKAILFNGSPKTKGNTSILLNKMDEIFKDSGIESQIYQIGGKAIHGCNDCRVCKDITGPNENRKCILKDDCVNECIQLMLESDIIIFGSPTYFANITPEIKALIDRAGRILMGKKEYLLKRKIGAGVLAVRRGGAIAAFDAINHFFLVEQMIVPGSSYWNFGLGLKAGDVLEDAEGLKTIENLANNIVFTANKICT